MSILEVNDVSIRYMTGDFKDIGLKEYVLRKIRGDYHINEFWADKDISFSLEQGDMLGIIGANGAGKSTLLKAISGIMEPTKGCVKRNGTVAALLELASGFDGDLTVRENTYLRGAMLGYTRKFMDETYEQIIVFAELEDFQDRPFKQLSSGMKSRLAFSIASLVKPDILILDEVLSVGDGAFRKKSEKKMKEIIKGGATTILVSHSLEQVRQMCTKVLWLDKGRQVVFGSNVQEICDQYQMFLEGKNGPILKEGCSEKREGDVMEMPGSSALSSMKKNQYIRFFGALLFAIITTAALGVNYSIASWDIAAQAIGSQNSILVSLVKLRQNFNLYTLPWQVCVVLLWGVYYKLGESWRFSAVEVVISLLFGTINVISNSLVVNGNWGFAFANTYQAVVASACVIGQAALFLSIIRLFFWLLDGLRNWKRKPVEPKGLARLFEKYPWRFSFCVLLLCWLPDLLIAYPAQLTADGANQLQQWMKIIPQTNAHPFLTTIIYGALFEIGQLFGNDNFTVFFIALAQSCIMAASFAVVVKKIKGMNIPKSIPVAILVFYGLHPMWGEYAHTIIKDSISVPVFTLFMLEIASFALDSVNYVSKKTNCCKIVSTGVLACMLRHNYKYAVIPAVLLAFGVVIWKNRQYWKRAIICVVILGGCLQTGGWIAESILKYSAGSVREALSIPFQQTARYVRDFPEEVTQEEKEAIAAILDYEALSNAYNPNSSDPVKNTYHGNQNSLKNYVSVWASMFIKHPETYFEATVHGSHAYYAYTPYLGVRTMADILRRDSGYRPYAERLGMDISHPEQMEPALIAWENTKELFIRAPISGFFCNCATYTWILLLLGIYFLKKKDWKIYYILVPLFLVVFTCIASPVNGNWRYFAPVVASVPIAIATSSMMIIKEQAAL